MGKSLLGIHAAHPSGSVHVGLKPLLCELADHILKARRLQKYCRKGKGEPIWWLQVNGKIWSRLLRFSATLPDPRSGSHAGDQW